MEKQIFTIPGISCGHCATAIQNELEELKGLVNVGGDPQTKSVTVEWQPPATASQIEDKLAKMGYSAST